MKTALKHFLSKSSKFVGTIASFITIENLIRDIKDQNTKLKYENVLDRNKELENKVVTLLEDKVINEEHKSKILELVHKRSNSLEIVREDVNKIQELNSKIANTELNTEVKESLTKEINKNLDSLSKNLDKDNINLSDLIEFINNLGSNSGSSSNSIINNINYTDLINNFKAIIDYYQTFLSNINIDQKISIANILISTTLLFFLFSLIGIYYSDYLIKKITILNKYPRITHILHIRKKFQEFYFLMNSLFLFLGLITIIYINYLYLTI